MPSLSVAATRALRCHHAGLGGTAGANVGTVLAHTTWVRTIGGADTYLALLARMPDLAFQDVEAALQQHTLAVVPAARGCMYLVGAADAPLARALARDLDSRRLARDRTKVGFDDAALDRTARAIVDHLQHNGPATTVELRSHLPEGTVVSFGAVGKRVGLSSSLPPTLRHLEFSGAVVRRPVDHRVDHERFAWCLPDKDAPPSIDPRPAAERNADLLRRLLRWMAPISVAALAKFTGLGKRAVRAALKATDARELTTDVDPDPVYALPSQTLDVDAPQQSSLLSGFDTLFAAHGGPGYLVEPADVERPIAVFGTRRGTPTWTSAPHSMTRTVVCDGRVCGIFEANPDTRQLDLLAFSPGLPDGAAAELERVRQLFYDTLGHAKVFSIDSDNRTRKRRALLGFD